MVKILFSLTGFGSTHATAIKTTARFPLLHGFFFFLHWFKNFQAQNPHACDLQFPTKANFSHTVLNPQPIQVGDHLRFLLRLFLLLLLILLRMHQVLRSYVHLTQLPLLPPDLLRFLRSLDLSLKI